MVHIELVHFLVSNPLPANVFGLCDLCWHKYVRMDLPCLHPGITIDCWEPNLLPLGWDYLGLSDH